MTQKSNAESSSKLPVLSNSLLIAGSSKQKQGGSVLSRLKKSRTNTAAAGLGGSATSALKKASGSLVQNKESGAPGT